MVGGRSKKKSVRLGLLDLLVEEDERGCGIRHGPGPRGRGDGCLFFLCLRVRCGYRKLRTYDGKWQLRSRLRQNGCVRGQEGGRRVWGSVFKPALQPRAYSGRLALPPPKVSSLRSGPDRYDASRAVFFFSPSVLHSTVLIDDGCSGWRSLDDGRWLRLVCVYRRTPLWPFCGCVDRGVPLLWVGSETRRSEGEVLE